MRNGTPWDKIKRTFSKKQKKVQKHDLTLWCLNVIFGEASVNLLEDELLLYELSLKSRRRLTALVESQRADFEQKHHSRFSLRERLWGNTFGLEVPVDRWINDSLSFIWTTRGDSLRTKGGFCNIHCPPPVYSLAPFPISDCESRLHLPVVSRVYFGGGSPRHFCFFMNRLLCGRRGLGVKAFSVSVSMCALYSSVCVYASVSYGCFFPPVQGVETYAIYVNVPLCATPRPGCISHLKWCL